MDAFITGIGTWLPEKILTNEAWSAVPKRERTQFPSDRTFSDRTFNDIPAPLDERAAGILERYLAAEASDPMLGATLRHIADEHQSTVQAEASAAMKALEMAKVALQDITLLLSNALVPDRLTPHAPAVASAVGAINAAAIGVDTVCASAINQIEIAMAYLKSGMAKHVLLTQSHLLLKTFDFSHPASPGIGDAATALVLSNSPGIICGLRVLGSASYSHGEFFKSVTWVRGNDDANDHDWWKAGGDFRLGSRDPAGTKYLMRETVSFAARTIQDAAIKASIDVRSIDVLASVQPRGFIPNAIAEYLGLAQTAAVTTYDSIAHVGACGPVFNLNAARERGRLPRGARIALYGQGAGFTRSATILEVAG